MVIRRDEIRSGVDENKVDLEKIAWIDLHFVGECKLAEHQTAEREIERMKRQLMQKIYGDANMALSEMKHAVMTSLRADVDPHAIAEMFRKVRETIPETGS